MASDSSRCFVRNSALSQYFLDEKNCRSMPPNEPPDRRYRPRCHPDVLHPSTIANALGVLTYRILSRHHAALDLDHGPDYADAHLHHIFCGSYYTSSAGSQCFRRRCVWTEKLTNYLNKCYLVNCLLDAYGRALRIPVSLRTIHGVTRSAKPCLLEPALDEAIPTRVAQSQSHTQSL